MIYTILILFPFMVSAIALPQISMDKGKTNLEKFFVALLIIFCLYFLADAFFTSEKTDYRAMIVLDIVSQYVTLAMIAMLFFFLRALNGKYSSPFVILLLVLPSALMGTASAMVYSMMGIDSAAAFVEAMDKDHGAFPSEFDMPIYHTQQFVCTNIYNTVTLLALLLLITYIIYVLVKNKFHFSDFKDLLNGSNKNPSAAISFLVLLILAICIARISLGRTFLLEHQLIAGIISFMIAVLLYISIWFFGVYANCNRVELHAREEALKTASAKSGNSQAQTQEDVSVVKIEKLVGSPEMPANDEKKAKLLKQFIEYMDTKKPYLNPNLSIDDVADDLKTNRTYISVICNQYYNLAFRDYINRKRIEYAKLKIAEDPNELMDNIATMSGYLSASQFNRKFKEIEGVTPRNWMFNHLRK